MKFQLRKQIEECKQKIEELEGTEGLPSQTVSMTSTSPPKKRILILSANSRGTSRLHLDEEMREIKEGLRRSQQRDEFEIIAASAVRYRDIQRAILDNDPQFVHFSGYGEGDEGKVFEDEEGQAKLVEAEALAGLFEEIGV